VLSFSSCDQRLQSEIETKRTNVENTLAEFQKKSSVITSISSTEYIDTTFDAAYQASLLTNDLVNSMSNLLLASCSITNPSLDGYRTTLSLVKTSMTGLFSDITAKRSALNLAKNTFNQASRDLDIIKAGTDPLRIKAQMALVAQAGAQVAQAESGLAKTMIVSPFSGFISGVDLSLGETVTLGKSVITMIALDGYEIEAKIPEIDIVKIKEGQDVDVTLDAYGKGVVFPAKVTRINPTATTEGTVPVYKVIVTFSKKDERIKQGMTANVQIVTINKTNVLTIPSRFVTLNTGESRGTVTVLSQGEQIEKDVALGVRGTDGYVEIVQGIAVGDVVVAPETTDRQAQKQTSK
jgi:RND family efflux transporter MFP subunit